MKTIQMTIDERLLQRVDQTVDALQTTRSAFIREALEQALRSYRIRRLEERDEVGYTAVPVNTREIDEWTTQQVWGDEWNEGK
jgi:metal-responsive CopG/Arc/MetJ family transcriptional regulator